MKPRRGLVPGALVLAACGLALLVVHPVPQAVQEVQRPLPSRDAASFPPSMEVSSDGHAMRSAVMATVQPASAPPPLNRPLFVELGSASDLRQFAVDAMTRPRDGGLSYALFATGLCRAFRSVLAGETSEWDSVQLPYLSTEDSQTYQRRAREFDRIKAACRGFTGADLSTESDTALIARADAERDPLRLISAKVRALSSSAAAGARGELLELVLQSADPLLLQATLERLILQPGADGKRSYYFDGAAVPAADADAFHAALQVLPCDLGFNCREWNVELSQRCITSGECAAGAVDFYRAQMDSQAASRFDFYRSQLLRIVRSQQASRLLRP